jgi:hypothetical protein
MVNLVATNANTPAGTYVVAVTATPTVAYSGVTVAALTENVTVTVGGAPPVAVAAGFTQLVFADDFTSTTATVTASNSATSGFNWYPGSPTAGTITVGTAPSATWPAASPSNITLYPLTTAASIANGNSGGGTNASPNGGIMTLNAPNGNIGNAIIGSMSVNTANASTTGPGAFLHFYAEFYAQFNIASGFTSPSWPGLWSAPIYDVDSLSSLPARTEIDFFEWHGDGGGSNNNWGSALHNWGAGVDSSPLNSTNLSTFNGDSNWHTYGVLWQSTGTGTGSVTFYFDGAEVGGSVTATGTGSSFPNTELYPVFLLISGPTGVNWNIDWVRVWQVPGSTVVNTPAVFNPPLG